MEPRLYLLLFLIGTAGCSESEPVGDICLNGDPTCAPDGTAWSPGIPALSDGRVSMGTKDAGPAEGGEGGDTSEAESGGDTNGDECEDGEAKCLENDVPAICINGFYVSSDPCPEESFCELGSCKPVGGDCVPGSIAGCFSETTLMVCEDKGVGYAPVPCPEGEYCLNGECGDQLCEPDTLTCVSINQPGQCNAEGDAYDELPICPDGGACVDGICKGGCAGLVKYGTSYIGCEYWSVDLDQYDDPFGDPKNAPYGVVISNPGTSTATISFVMGNGDSFAPADSTVAPGVAQPFILPTLNDDGTGISNKSVQILSDRPITVHQFNPMDNTDQVASNDASLLLPANVLGMEYYILTWSTTPIINIFPDDQLGVDCCTNADCENAEVCCEMLLLGTKSCEDKCDFPFSPSTCQEGDENNLGLTGLLPQHGYMTIVASSPGKSLVTVTVTAPVLAGPGVQPMQPGQSQTFDLNQFEVLTLQASAPEDATLQDIIGLYLDLTGSHVISDKPIVVFGGHEEAVVGVETDGKDNCCAEHLEEQLFPVVSWGTELLCVKTRPRSDPPENDHWRVVASEDGTVLTTIPAISNLNGVTLNAGEWAEGATPESFLLTASKPIEVAQYTVGQGLTDEFTGDPSMILAVPQSQFREDYLILTPVGYTENFLTVMRPTGLAITMDGTPIPDSSFTSFGDGTWEFAYPAVAEGSHQLVADEAFGVSAYGWSGAVSYGYPGGLDLDK